MSFPDLGCYAECLQCPLCTDEELQALIDSLSEDDSVFDPFPDGVFNPFDNPGPDNGPDIFGPDPPPDDSGGIDLPDFLGKLFDDLVGPYDGLKGGAVKFPW